MPPSEMEVFKELLLSFKLEIHDDLKQITNQIEKLNNKIEDFQKDNGKINIELGIITERQNNIKSNLKNNFQQHEDFYKRLGELEKLPDVSQKTEDNENEIIKIRTTARTFNIILGIIIAIIGALSALKII